ncbi:hypothetical protein BBP40_010454 [Aspergillus hancockii]|nr:hypothetical protein BBP40_010454 [Aspergillus hancockii]
MVSRKISRQKLTPYPHAENNPAGEEDDRQLKESYAAYLRAFSEGRTGAYNSTTGGVVPGYELDYEDEDGVREVSGQGAIESGRGQAGDYFSGPHPGKYEGAMDGDLNGGAAGGRGERAAAGRYTFLRHARSGEHVLVQDDAHRGEKGKEHVPDFEPIGSYGFSPLAGSGLEPPPRILTPAIHAETTRVEREKKSEELRQKQRRGPQQKGGGFWAPLRALWLHLRRSR